MDIKYAIKRTTDGEHLTLTESSEVMRAILHNEVTPAQFGALVCALHKKGETPEELAGMAKAMRDASIHITGFEAAIDTCGCGGDNLGWFNVSTAAAIVAASAGAVVAKHGNRAMSGTSGSADVLEQLGISTVLPNISDVTTCLREVGIAFLFAPVFHPAMKFASPLRREIGIPTVFNLLGPLCNPAGVRRQVLGVPSTAIAQTMAKALQILGTEYTLVVNAESGADELDVEGHTMLYQVTPSTMKRRRTRAADFGLPEGNRDDLKVNNPEQSAAVIKRVLEGKGGEHNAPPSAERSAFLATVINASAALVVAGKAVSFQDGAQYAKEVILSGAAQAKLNSLKDLTHSLQGTR